MENKTTNKYGNANNKTTGKANSKTMNKTSNKAENKASGKGQQLPHEITAAETADPPRAGGEGQRVFSAPVHGAEKRAVFSARHAVQGCPHRKLSPAPCAPPGFLPTRLHDADHTTIIEPTPTPRGDTPGASAQTAGQGRPHRGFRPHPCAPPALPSVQPHDTACDKINAHTTQRCPGASAQTAAQGRPHRGFRPHPVRRPAFCPPGYTMPPAIEPTPTPRGNAASSQGGAQNACGAPLLRRLPPPGPPPLCTRRQTTLQCGAPRPSGTASPAGASKAVLALYSCAVACFATVALLAFWPRRTMFCSASVSMGRMASSAAHCPFAETKRTVWRCRRLGAKARVLHQHAAHQHLIHPVAHKGQRQGRHFPQVCLRGAGTQGTQRQKARCPPWLQPPSQCAQNT